MNMNLVNEITATQLRKDIPEFRSGDTVKVHVRITEGEKSRIQIYEGLVISVRGGGVSKTFWHQSERCCFIDNLESVVADL